MNRVYLVNDKKGSKENLPTQVFSQLTNRGKAILGFQCKNWFNAMNI